MVLGTLVNDSFPLFNQFQENHPYLSAMAIAEATFLACEAISQLTLNRKINKAKLFYTAALAPQYGVCVKGYVGSGELVGRCISDEPLVKAALGPNLFTNNALITFFLANNNIGAKNNYEITSL